MANVSKEAGPEWAYCAPLARKNSTKVDFDSLYVNIQRQGADPVIDSLQVLSEEQQGTYMPSSVLRFRFHRLRSLIGSQGSDFDLFFEAFEDAGGDVPIPDSQSFRRLLVAIGHLGLPLPSEGDPNTDFPPVLRFVAKPKAADPIRANVARPNEGQAPRTPPARDNLPSRPNTPGAPRPVFPTRPQTPSGLRPQTPSGIRPQTPSGIRTRPPSTPRPESPAGPSGTSTPSSVHDGPGKRSSLSIVHQANDPDDERTGQSFLPDPVEPEEELSFGDRIDQNMDYGFSDQKGLHEERIHNLYADIAGISRGLRNPEREDHKYKPPYSNISLPPHQSYPTGWLLHDSNRIMHYLADKPGLGKTFAAIEAVVRVTMILSNNVEVDNEEKNLSELQQRPVHMHDKAHRQFGKNENCRADTVSRFGIVCTCRGGSASRRIVEEGNFSLGYMLIMVPLNVITQWFLQIKRFIRSTTRLPHNQKAFEVINIHDDPAGPGPALRRFIYEKREHAGLGTICLVPITTAVGSALDSLVKGPKREMLQQPSMIVIDEVHTIRTITHQSVRLVEQLIDRSVYPVHVLALSGTPMSNGPADFEVIERIALLENPFRGWYGADKYDDYQNRIKKARRSLSEHAKEVVKSGMIGRGKTGLIPDEERAEIEGLRNSYDQRAREYAAEVPLLQRKQRADYLGYRIPKTQPDSAPPQILRCDSRMNEVQKGVASQYKEYLRLRFRHKVRNWSRKPEATRGPRPKMREILFDLPSKKGQSHASVIDGSLIGFAPGLAKRVLDRSNEEQFRSKEANDIFRRTDTFTQRRAVMNSPYGRLAEAAFQRTNEQTGQRELHPKIVAICKILDEMLADNELHADRPRRLGSLPKKAVIVVPHAWQGYILTAYLFQRYPTRNFTFVGAGQSDQERKALLAPFERPTDVQAQEDKRNDDPIALISTFNMIGYGLNLTRANYAITTSPLASRAQEEQMFSRVDRQGQQCKCHSYVLLDNGNPVDAVTFYRMRMRTALTVPQEEHGPAFDFLLEDIDEVENEEIDTSYQSGEEDSGDE